MVPPAAKSPPCASPAALEYPAEAPPSSSPPLPMRPPPTSSLASAAIFQCRGRDSAYSVYKRETPSNPLADTIFFPRFQPSVRFSDGAGWVSVGTGLMEIDVSRCQRSMRKREGAWRTKIFREQGAWAGGGEGRGGAGRDVRERAMQLGGLRFKNERDDV